MVKAHHQNLTLFYRRIQMETAKERITPHEYALRMGWDYSHIHATAYIGVAPRDRENLRSTTLTPKELKDWCISQTLRGKE